MAEVALWQYRWTNPGDDANVTPAMLAWKEVTPWNPRMQTLEQRIEELRSFRYNGKPAYEVRALGVLPAGVEPSGLVPLNPSCRIHGQGRITPPAMVTPGAPGCTCGVALPPKPFPAPGKWFPVDITGTRPMREHEPGKWELAAWPSDGVEGTLSAGGTAVLVPAKHFDPKVVHEWPGPDGVAIPEGGQ